MMPFPFYETVSEDERARIDALRAILANDAIDYFAPDREHLPLKTFEVIGEIVAAAAPDAPEDNLKGCARFCMWMYLLDYYFDEIPGASDEAREALQSRVASVLNLESEPPAFDTFLERSLYELCSGFKKSEAGPALLGPFKRQILREMDAGRALFAMGQAKRERADISLFGYLEVALHAVNHISCTMSLLFAIGDALAPHDVAALEPALRDAAACIRMANDLRTFAKNDAEGLPHVLSFGNSAGEIRVMMAERYGQCVRSLEEFVARGGPAKSAEGIHRITRIGIEVYGLTDIRYDL